jgi:hypothetical protein
VIETAAARSVVQLNGVQLTLAPESRAKVYRDRTVLEKGTGMLRDSDRHVFQAGSLRISPDAKGSVVQVDLQGTSHVSVFAFSGSAQVRNASGLLLASVRPGMALAFDMPPQQASGSNAVKLSGKVSEQDGKFFLTDHTTSVTVQLEGNDLLKLVGKNVEISGAVIPSATAAAGASEVVSVAAAHILAGAGMGAAATGIAVGAKVAIIAGVAVAGTVGGLAASGTLANGPSTSAQ